MLPVDEDEDDEDSEVVDAAVDVVDDVALRGSSVGGVNVCGDDFVAVFLGCSCRRVLVGVALGMGVYTLREAVSD